MKLGYACINMTLSGQKPKITTNRSMIKKTFLTKGIDYAGELALLNCTDLYKIILWNVKNNVKFFRVSSDIFPWASEYNIEDLPQYEMIKIILSSCGQYVKDNGLRLTTHPGPFNVLVSPREHVVKNTITDLTNHGKVFDLLELTRTPYNKINIHCNGVYGDKKAAMDRFCENFQLLPESVQTRLTVENDDKASMYSVKDLMYIHEKIGIPIVFDYHHHKFCTGGQDEEEALLTACTTWGDIRPVVHYSQSRSVEHNDPKIRDNAHSDSYWTAINLYGLDLDVMLECKHKELGLFKMRELMEEENERLCKAA